MIILDTMSWQHFVQLDYIRRLPLNEQLKRYNYYLMEQQAMQVTVNNTAAAAGGGQSSLQIQEEPTSGGQILMGVEFIEETLFPPGWNFNFRVYFPESSEVLATLNNTLITANFDDGFSATYTEYTTDNSLYEFDIYRAIPTFLNGTTSVVINVNPSTYVSKLLVAGLIGPNTNSQYINSISFSNFPNVTGLELPYQPITTLDISTLPNLEILYADNTNLTSLTFTTLPNLLEIDLRDGALSESMITQILVALDANGLTNGYADFVNNYSGTNAAITNQTGLDAIDNLTAKGWAVSVAT